MARRHTQREKASAVATAERLNSSDAAGEELGIPGRTIRRWRDEPEMAAIIRKTREETAEDVTVAMVLSWTRLIERLQRDEVETRDLIILAGVATDKSQLLAGHATSRAESRDLTDIFDDHETRAIVAQAREYLAGAEEAEGQELAVPPAVEPVGAGGTDPSAG